MLILAMEAPTNGRSLSPYGEAGEHDDAEVYGIHANGIDNGQQKRSDDHDDGGSFEEGAQNEQHDEDERHDDDLARGDAHDGIEHGGGKVVVHHDPWRRPPRGRWRR